MNDELEEGRLSSVHRSAFLLHRFARAVEEFAAVGDEVETGGRVAAGEVFDELFEHVEAVAVGDALRVEVAAAAHAADEVGQRQAPLEGAPAVAVRAADEVLNQQHVVVERGREEEAKAFALPALFDALRAAKGARAVEGRRRVSACGRTRRALVGPRT